MRPDGWPPSLDGNVRWGAQSDASSDPQSYGAIRGSVREAGACPQVRACRFASRVGEDFEPVAVAQIAAAD